jgi:polyhydroxyalkanoate synthesis regulator phasin
MFGLGKLAILESKLDIYEDLSKEMLDKLERAVSTISENSNRIAIVLERHENRLDEGDKSNQLILKMVEDLKENQEKDITTLHERISKLQEKVNENQKFMIMISGCALAIVTVLQVLPMIGLQLTPVQKSSMIGTEVVRSIS